jgi:hypothetical protein
VRRSRSGFVGGRDWDRRRGGRGRRCGLNGCGRGRLGFLDRLFLAEASGIGEAADAVRHRVLDARRVAFHADLELVSEVEDHLVLDAELPCELVNPDLLGGQGLVSLPRLAASAGRSAVQTFEFRA